MYEVLIIVVENMMVYKLPFLKVVKYRLKKILIRENLLVGKLGMKVERKLLMALLVLCFVKKVSAQDALSHYNKNHIGFVTGMGVQYAGQLVGDGSRGFNVASNYYYHVTFYELQYYRAIKKRKNYLHRSMYTIISKH